MAAINKKELMAQMTGGINDRTPILTIANSQFNVKFGKEKKKVTLIDTQLQAMCADVVLVAANNTTSKVFYDGPYKDGSEQEPACFSDNGFGPSSNAKAPQSLLCAGCPRNVWGDSGTECKPSKKVALIVPKYDDAKLCLFRVPTASMRNYKAYIDSLAKVIAADGTEAHAADVMTRIYFEPDKLNILNFKMVDVLDTEDPAHEFAFECLGDSHSYDGIVGLRDVAISEQRFEQLTSHVGSADVGNAAKAFEAKRQQHLLPTYRTIEEADEIVEAKDDALLDEDAAFLAALPEAEVTKTTKVRKAR